MKRIHYLTIALTIVGLAFYAGRMTGDSPSRDEAQQQATPPASCAPTPERKIQFTPGNPANTAHIANTDPAKAVSAQPVNRQGVSTDGMQDDLVVVAGANGIVKLLRAENTIFTW